MSNSLTAKRLKIIITGAVQGVGFRPFIYRIANELNIKGFIKNSSFGVEIEAEAKNTSIIDTFINRIKNEKPVNSIIFTFSTQKIEPQNTEQFIIVKSDSAESKTAFILPDIAICPDCLNELFEPSNRRYLYPFINCTNCGPRYSIIDSLPYDRPNTSMYIFQMCENCQNEYENPNDRRFHAQPNACPDCGPQLSLLDNNGNNLAKHNEAIILASKYLKNGKIVAFKSIGGFQLMVDATNSEAINLLRKRKRRSEKPFAVMLKDLNTVEFICFLNEAEKKLLTSTQAPIVLLSAKPDQKLIARECYPNNNPYLGVMLPYTPMHYVLMKYFDSPLIATSANISEEPIIIDENVALEKLKTIADVFLVHNRPILRRVDDSITRIIDNNVMILRRARGYAPLPIIVKQGSGTGDTWKTELTNSINTQLPEYQQEKQQATFSPKKESTHFHPFKKESTHFSPPKKESTHFSPPKKESTHFSPFKKESTHFSPPKKEGSGEVSKHIIALGPHLKNTITVLKGSLAFLSQHIGDLSNLEAYKFHSEVLQDFIKLYDITPEQIVSDKHPDFLSKENFPQYNIKALSVQHHKAHIASCRAEHHISGNALGFAFDGTGYGDDGAVWGGEIIFSTETSYERIGAFEYFPLFGGDSAIKEPRKAAYALLNYLYGDNFSDTYKEIFKNKYTNNEIDVFNKILKSKINVVQTSSLGRLFDIVASVIGLKDVCNYEAQAAMMLEYIVATNEANYYNYTIEQTQSGFLTIKLKEIFDGILNDLNNKISNEMISAKFHNTISEIILNISNVIGEKQIILSGGCFQNKYLLENSLKKLKKAEYNVYFNQMVPINDGGISLGQVYMGLSRESI